jgi:hypothetical protein
LKTAFTDSELEQLLNFIGYGRLDAEIWFLGMHEQISGDEHLETRLKFNQVEDLAEANELLEKPQSPSEEANFSVTRHNICYVMLKLHAKETSGDAIREYEADFLGRDNGTTLLCNLMPLPTSDPENWIYDTLIPQFATYQAYYKAIKPRRLELFSEVMRDNHPKTIVAYGKNHWNDYKELFDNFKFSSRGQFEVGWNADTVVILADDFSSPAINESLDELTALILENSLSIETSIPTGSATLSQAEEKRRKKEAARQTSAAKRKPSARHNPADPYCVCEYCLGYESIKTGII